MFLKKYLLIFFSILCLYCLSSTFIFACQCSAKLTVLSEFESSKDIFIAKIVSIEKAKDVDFYENCIKSVKVLVQKVYKGKYIVGDEIIIEQGQGGDCGWIFEEKDMDKELLIYDLSNFFNRQTIIYCGRANELKSAADDLLYLNNLEKVKSKSRISGTLFYGGKIENRPSVENQIVKITNVKTKKMYKVKTDKNGVYEIYNLPVGWYNIEPEITKGWSIRERYWQEIPQDYQETNKLGEKSFLTFKEEPNKPVSIYLFRNRHAGLDFNFVN